MIEADARARTGGESSAVEPAAQQAAPLPELPAPATMQPQLSQPPPQQNLAELPPLDRQQPFLDPLTGLAERQLQPMPLPHQLQARQQQGTSQLQPHQAAQSQQQQPQPQQQRMSPAPAASGRPEASRSLYVGKLHPHVNEAMLLEIFSTLGAVQEVKVIRDKLTSLSAGYGFITYYDPKCSSPQFVRMPAGSLNRWLAHARNPSKRM